MQLKKTSSQIHYAYFKETVHNIRGLKSTFESLRYIYYHLIRSIFSISHQSLSQKRQEAQSLLWTDLDECCHRKKQHTLHCTMIFKLQDVQSFELDLFLASGMFWGLWAAAVAENANGHGLNYGIWINTTTQKNKAGHKACPVSDH